MGGEPLVKREPQNVEAQAPDSERVQVKVIVQPPELFVDNKAKILEVASTNNYTVVYREKNGEHQYVIYDESGKVLDPGRATPGFVITQGVLADTLYQNGHRAIDISSNASYDSFTVARACKALGLPDSAHEEMKRRLKNNNASNWISEQTLRDKPGIVYEPPAKIFSDATKTKLVFQREKSLTIYNTISNGGGVLPPVKWEVIQIADNSSITTDQLQKMPFLREFMQTQKGRPLTGLDRAVDNERGILNIIDTKQNIRIFSDASAGYAVDPNDTRKIYYLSPNNELKSVDAKQASLTQTQVETRPLPFTGKVRDLKLDPQGNFFIVHLSQDNKDKLLILEKDSLAQVAEIPGVSGGVDLDNLGNIYFIDADRRLRLANTNFMTFAKDGLEMARNEKKERLKALAERLSNLTLPDKPPSEIDAKNADLLTEEQLFRRLSTQVEERFGPMVEAAGSISELDKLSAGIEAVKLQEDFKGNSELFTPIEEKIRGRMQGFKTHALTEGIQNFRERLEGSADPAAVAELEGSLSQLLKQRRGVSISDAPLRRSIDSDLRDFEGKVKDLIASVQEEVLAEVEKRYAAVKDLISDSGSLEELNALALQQEVTGFEDQLAIVSDRKIAGRWRAQYRQDVNEKREDLKREARQAEEEERTRLAQTAEESREILAEIKAALADEVSDETDLGRWEKGNPLLTRYRTKIIALPDDIRRSEEDRLEKLIEQKRRDFDNRKVLLVPEKGNELSFGDQSFPIFESPQIIWQPKIKPLNPGNAYGNLVFEDNLGRTFTPRVGTLLCDSQDAVTKEAIALYQQEAEIYFTSFKRKVPDFNPKWVLNDCNKGILGKVARFCKIQLGEQRGILIMEGEAGTGKNVLVDMFAHFTNRETHTFSCNFQSEKEDLTYAFRFDPQRGTYQVDSKFIQMLQTPGAVVVLDEINTLPPGVAKMLNPLLDYRRTLYLPDGREIKVDPSVIIVGTMNPQHYLGVKPLSQEVKSRSRMMYVDYPPEKAGGKFTPYEAEMLARYCDDLTHLNQENFYKAWNYVVNHDQANGADLFLTDEIKSAINKLHHVIKTAFRVREAYQSFRVGKSTDIVEFVFSLRETCDIAAELKYNPDVRSAIKDVVLPKIGDPAEKERVETIIDNV